MKIYSDTGYRAVPMETKPEAQYDIDYLDTLPHCPAFKGKKHNEIGHAQQ